MGIKSGIYMFFVLLMALVGYGATGQGREAVITKISEKPSYRVSKTGRPNCGARSCRGLRLN